MKFKPTFDDAQEEDLVKYPIDMSRRFYAIPRLALAKKACRMAELNSIEHPFRTGKADKDWVTSCVRRLCDKLSMRTATPISLVRVLALTNEAVDRFFDNLEDVLRTHNYPVPIHLLCK